MEDKTRHIESLLRQHYRVMFRLASIILHDNEESMDIMHVYLRSQHGVSSHYHPPIGLHPAIQFKV